MENKQNPKENQSAQQILRRIETESAEQKKKAAYEILLRQQRTGEKAEARPSLLATAKQIYETKLMEIMRKWKAPQTQRAFWLTGFLIVSTFICWKVEFKFDQIKKKASTTKTFKEARIEKQNIEINKYLSRNEFESVPIRAEREIKNSYRFEQDEGVFDTKDYLLEHIAKQYRDGAQIDPDMLEELKKKGFI